MKVQVQMKVQARMKEQVQVKKQVQEKDQIANCISANDQYFKSVWGSHAMRS